MQPLWRAQKGSLADGNFFENLGRDGTDKE
jgi:hypothetical protein